MVKFFPADIYGGLKAIKSLSGPFYDVQFLPTGGIDETNFIEYVEAKEVLAVGGSFILSEKMLQEDEAWHASMFNLYSRKSKNDKQNKDEVGTEAFNSEK